MNAYPLDQAWLAAWRHELDDALEPLLATFESTYGYPPGDNRVIPPDGQAPRKFSSRHGTPPGLVPFYQAIHEVRLPDIGNGYFIHPPVHVLDELAREGPVRLPESATGAVFASDGGGILYAIAADGTIHRSAAASRDSNFKLTARDLTSFLNQVRQAVLRFAATGEPGQL